MKPIILTGHTHHVAPEDRLKVAQEFVVKYLAERH